MMVTIIRIPFTYYIILCDTQSVVYWILNIPLGIHIFFCEELYDISYIDDCYDKIGNIKGLKNMDYFNYNIVLNVENYATMTF